MTTGYSVTLRNAQLDPITTAVGNAGLLRVYDGTRPATGGAATVKLAEFTLGTPFAPGAAAAVLSPTLPSSTTGLAASTASWFRVVTSGDLQLNTTTISIGLTINVTSWSITRGNP